MIADMLKESKERMRGAISALKEDLAAIRTGRATPALVEKLSVEYYGQPTPLMQMASISVPEPRQLLIKPFDPSSIRDIEKAVQTSDLGLTPNSDGKVVRLNLPPLTEDRRRDLVKVVNARLEEANVAVRNIRRDVIKDMREAKDEKLVSEDELKRGEEDIQKLTDEITAEIVAMGKQKEKEVMEV
ncbi:MAG: ribosome recycling factor [Anaerolineales bacterium]|nr:ribosome recycling factor [Anaerolineales bacterium]MBX3005121.1 ribosome recycling factor [Anaerolineales bacterium]MCW5838668.1 ribosome recycling factor [Anaerolineales bacterium]MCW5888725.1 ribosome recycling factor [Anaerolineales bacterium]